MNIAFYVDSLAENEQTKQIFNCLNTAIDKEKVEDACLFYNVPAFNSNLAKFGFFNSTDLWSFTGLLINTTISGAIYSLNIVNKFKPAYLFTKKVDIMGLLYVSSKMPVFVLNEEDKKEIHRITGKTAKIIKLNSESLIEVLNG